MDPLATTLRNRRQDQASFRLSNKLRLLMSPFSDSPNLKVACHTSHSEQFSEAKTSRVTAVPTDKSFKTGPASFSLKKKPRVQLGLNCLIC